ncbi:MAG: DUF3052 family protein [Acidobacteriaceae bacterium]|nr:DUF3052 family protein [Acidobacteriaceae bacterium]
MLAGYSQTPLAKKLGIKNGQKTWRVGMPASVERAIADYGVSPKVLHAPVAGVEMVHLFVTQRLDLVKHLAEIKPLLAPDGVIWISWPKKSAGCQTDLSVDAIRAQALPLDLVDVKVCAVDEIWSGLKFVIRKSKRAARPKQQAS